MAKDKVFGAKVSNGKQFIAPGKSWLDYYYEDQEKRKKEEEQGKVRYTEAAKASRVQYSIPQYAGKSQNQGKTYQWERDLMANEKIKGAGNSYTKKFDALTKRMGMTEGQASEFRKYLDFQEDSQHVKPKMNKDKSINQSQSLKYARDAHLEVDVIDDMFKNMTKTNAARVKYDNAIEAQKENKESENLTKSNQVIKANQAVQTKQKKKDEPFLNDVKNFFTGKDTDGDGQRNGLYGFLDRYVLPVSQGATNVILPGNEEVQIQNEIAKYGEVTNPATKAGMVDRGLETDILEGAGTMAGYLAPYGQGYGAVNAALKLPKLAKAAQFVDNNPYKGRAAVGGAAGLLAESGLAATNELANSEAADMSDYALRVGLGVAGGAIGDPLLHGAGNLIKGGLGRFAKVDGELPTFSGNASDSVLDSLAPSQTTNSVKASDDLYSRLLGQETPAPPAPRQPSMDDFVPNELPRVEEPTSLLDELLFGQRGNGPKARGTVDQVPMARYARENISNQADEILNSVSKSEGANQRLLDVQQEMKTMMDKRGIYREQLNPDELYLRVRQEGDPATFDDLIKLAELESNAQPVQKDIKAILRDDPRVAEQIKALNELGGAKPPQEPQLNGNYGQANLGPIDELLEMLGENPQIVNNSQVPEQAIESLVQTVAKESPEKLDDLLMTLDGKLNRPKPETEVTNPAPASGDNVTAGESFDPLVRLNIQQHAPGTGGPKLISDGPMTSEKAITKFTDKAYENYVNSNHSAKVAEVKVLENAAKQAKAEGRVKKAAQLEKQAKSVKKHGSDFEKAVGNEAAAAAASTNFLKRHMKNLKSTVKDDAELAQFLNYQMAKDLDWRRNNGLGEYELPENVDWGDINALVQEADANPKYADFDAAIREWTQEWRDVMKDYNLINKEGHEALSKNPHYMYLGKDLTHQMDNIDKGTDFRSVSDKRASGPNIVHSQTGGDAKSLFQNPIDNLINNTFSVFKNAYKEETGRQALRMAKLDKDGLFFKEISEKGYNSGGGIKVSNGGKPRYVRMQDDLMKMIKENDAGLDMNVMTQLTSAFAGLKTRSLEYQTAALIRDTGTSMVASQIKNPIRYFKEYAKSLKNGSADAKKIGGYFDKAHNAQTAGLDPKKVLKEFQRQHGSVKSFDLKKPGDWKELANTVGRILDTPFKYTSKLLGQVSDEIPRDIEVRETERLFMKQHGKKIEAIQSKIADIDSQLAQAQNAPDFSPETQGIDKLAGQKQKLEKMLGDINRDLKREQIYRSRDVINYSRAGRGDIAKGIRKYVVFANTTTQSKDKMIRSFIERPGSTLMKAATAMAPLVAAQKVMFDKLDGEDKETYERVPAYIKLNNFVFVDKGNVYTVPKIQELALVTNPLEAILHGEKLNDSMKHLAKESVPYQGGNIAQALIPDEEGNTLFDRNPYTKVPMGATLPTTAVTPGIDVLANDKLGFNRKPISYKADEANKWTPEVIRKIVGDNPNSDAADYLVRQLLGDYGKYAVYGADAAADPSKKKVDELIRNLNPLQDRIYDKDGYKNILGLKVPFKEPILDKKKE